MTPLTAIKRLIPQRSPIRLLWHRLRAYCAALVFGFPARRLTIIGITGTDGKTTTVSMTAHILAASSVKCGALSTAFLRIGDEVTWNATQKTSPSPFLTQKFLRRLVRIGCTHAVLEYSSHGLVQGRSNWTWPAVAAITNTSREHLDYHGTMEQYRRDKALIFAMMKSNGTKVLNAGDETFAQYRSLPGKTLAYGTSAPTSQGDSLWVTDIAEELSASRATTHLRTDTMEQTASLTLRIPGSFNIENSLCAIGCALACGISFDASVRALESFRGVPGRMEKIEGPQPFSVFVDFTVTPIAYEKTLTTLHRTLGVGNRLLVLTGSCGERMREKRPEVGRIVSALADVTVVSNEDPYNEDPQKIIDEVWAGVDTSKTAYKIFDRLEAIRFLFANAKPGDVVVLCGKGSDTTMTTSAGTIPWNEREIARELLRQFP